MDDNLKREVEGYIQAGCERITLGEFDRRLQALGYKRDLSSRCSAMSLNLTTGNSFPAVTFNPMEIDTKRSAYHFESRRDDNFKALQEMRLSTVVVHRGAIYSV